MPSNEHAMDGMPWAGERSWMRSAACAGRGLIETDKLAPRTACAGQKRAILDFFQHVQDIFQLMDERFDGLLTTGIG